MMKFYVQIRGKRTIQMIDLSGPCFPNESHSFPSVVHRQKSGPSVNIYFPESSTQKHNRRKQKIRTRYPTLWLNTKQSCRSHKLKEWKMERKSDLKLHCSCFKNPF
ncbi:hypothetical protein CIPAW_02G129500 [Carya illinoinensis]|uniref:Uncharacterized protein n=1 Tax=Carya illinoinensis TaxID=32201 RepID=A0A8T1RGB6_CARIL|nr:hypothetical protein CIPAW_02G129500 [Carya illinoinensis]